MSEFPKKRFNPLRSSPFPNFDKQRIQARGFFFSVLQNIICRLYRESSIRGGRPSHRVHNPRLRWFNGSNEVASMSRKEALKGVPLPLRIANIGTHSKIVLAKGNNIWKNRFQFAQAKNPDILPKPHMLAITHNPTYIVRDHGPHLTNGTPCRGRAGARLHLRHLVWTSFILLFHNLDTYFIWVGHKLPGDFHHVGFI